MLPYISYSQNTQLDFILFFYIASNYCKEVLSDTCHKKKEVWYEYFPAKNINGAGKCKKMKCGKKGPKPVKNSKGISKQMNVYLIIITASVV